MRENGRPFGTQAAYEPRRGCFLGEDLRGPLLNESTVSQNWVLDFCSSLCGQVDSKGTILILLSEPSVRGPSHPLCIRRSGPVSLMRRGYLIESPSCSELGVFFLSRARGM